MATKEQTAQPRAKCARIWRLGSMLHALVVAAVALYALVGALLA